MKACLLQNSKITKNLQKSKDFLLVIFHFFVTFLDKKELSNLVYFEEKKLAFGINTAIPSLVRFGVETKPENLGKVDHFSENIYLKNCLETNRLLVRGKECTLYLYTDLVKMKGVTLKSESPILDFCFFHKNAWILVLTLDKRLSCY